MTEDKEGEGRAQVLKGVGADLAGAVGGVGATALVGPVAGAAIGVAITRGANAVGRLFHREQERVGATLLLIEQDSQERQQRGESPRDNGFFDDRGTLRPEAEELLEAVLRQAAASFEERKLPLLARLYSEVAHDRRVGPDEALYLTKLIGDLTYRQLLILSCFAWVASSSVQGAARRDLAALNDLGERGLIAVGTDDGQLRAPGRLGQSPTYADVKSFPASIADAWTDDRTTVEPTETGFRLLQLIAWEETIPESDRLDWLNSDRFRD